MKIKNLNLIVALSLCSSMACSQNNTTDKMNTIETSDQNNESNKSVPHQFGGWYCPDNLIGFPATDLNNWKNVPVVRDRMPTKEETQNGKSLIFIDTKKYPNARSLDFTLPKLANIYNIHSKRDELIIVIQAIKVGTDSIVGFRYLNGGNGSARFNEVNFLSDQEVQLLPPNRFVSHTISINAKSEKVSQVLSQPEYAESLQPDLDKEKALNSVWRETTNVNYHYPGSGMLTASYADILFGNFYIQNDYDSLNFTEKFLLLENNLTKQTVLKIVCGPFGDDFEKQKSSILDWAHKLKTLSENN